MLHRIAPRPLTRTIARPATPIAHAQEMSRSADLLDLMQTMTERVPGVMAVMALLLLSSAASADSATINNLTGLPAYPNLNRAVMDDVLRTENLGRWCARFTATTWDSLSAVEEWYRRTLARASETDLARDERFKIYSDLSGIKLALGVDYVALYRRAHQPTTIELHRCSWSK
jgi:hypothetical protein